MCDRRRLERVLYPCPVINCGDYEEYPLVAGRDWYWMERETLRLSKYICVYLYFRYEDDDPYIEVYIWEQMNQFKADCIRFIIREGMCLSEELEDKLLFYTKESRLLGCETQMEAMYYFLNEYFPQWHYYGYGPSFVGKALEHIYFASHPSGPREILYKAELDNLAYRLDNFDCFNVIGTTPKEIIGHNIPKKLLRIMNHSMFTSYYSKNELIERCINVYSVFSGYIPNANPSYGQWYYLEQLYDKGMIEKDDFNRKIYDHLGSARRSRFESRLIVSQYFNLLELRNRLGISKRTHIPDPDDLEEEIIRLEEIKDPDLKLAFENRAANESAKYEYFDKEYGVIFPKTSADIHLEALSLNNCLDSYIRKHGRGDTTILFVREMNRADKSFVAIEVCDKKILQAYSACNQRPKPEVLDFLCRYASIKEFKFDPEEACELARGQ